MPGFSVTTRLQWSRASPRGAVFDLHLLDERDGFRSMQVSGDIVAIEQLMRLSGGHRWQRVPPTERRGRVQTSTVTMAVLPLPPAGSVTFEESDIEEDTKTAGTAGGQHQNVTESAVRLRHRPTGIIVCIATHRSQHRNRALARRVLNARLAERQRQDVAQARNRDRRNQIGSGERGDKVRTYRVRDGVVIDHASGRKLSLRRVLAGEIA